MRFIKTLSNVCTGLVVTEGIPQSIRSQDQKFRPKFVKVKRPNIRLRSDELAVFQWIVTKGTGRGKDTGNSPDTVETYKATGFLYSLSFFSL